MPSIRSLGFLYRDAAVRPSTGAVGESTAIRFTNIGRRALQVVVYPLSDNDAVFVVNVTNTETEEVFGIRDWLRQYSPENAESSHFKLSNYPGTPSEQIDGFLAYLDRVLSSEGLKDLLAGTSWERIYFDWAGMR